jgi:4,5-DOPA dioxygenase extradiol
VPKISQGVLHDDSNASNLHRTWQPNECHIKEYIHRKLGFHRQIHPPSSCRTFSFRPLVCPFPSKLYEVNYPAPGSPDLAIQVQQLLSPVSVILDESWGLDHGTWSVLTHIFPDADIPVVQLSIDERQPPAFHYELGKRLEALRKEGVLILGSGNLVHNLHSYAWGQGRVQPFDWAIRFESRIRQLLSSGNDEQIIEYQKLGHDARLAVPTPDHYLPMLYVIGLRSDQDKISFPVEGVDGGSISMLAIQVG